MEGVLITSVISSVGLGLSSFFGFFLLRNNKPENRLLAWLLIALSLRITKSIFYIHLELPLMIKNLGLAANLAVGPLLYLYVRAFLGREQSSTNSSLHFVPAILYVVFSPLLPNGGDSNFWTISYSFILLQSFVYVSLSIALLAKKNNQKRRKNIKWVIALIAGLSMMWLTYAMIFIKVLPTYSLGPVIFSISIFILLYVALNHYQLFLDGNNLKYSNARLSEEQGRSYYAQLEALMVTHKIFKHTDLSLSYLAKEMNVLERDVSLIINKHGNGNFSQFINAYRIEEAKRLITDDPSKKLIAVAYESGFNNLSTFNQVFKSNTGITPSAFKKK